MASGIWHLLCQTYTLNLNFIEPHGSQKQTPFLFSSPRSFRVAKLPTLSARLSPISKLLSKPSLFFAPLLLLSYTHGAQALSAYTSSVIEGSAPYLTFDGGQTKVTDTESLLFITLQDGTKFTPSTNPSSSTSPIRLPNAGSKLGDITMIVPPSESSITMNDLVVAQGYWGDDDGDGQGTGGVTATGSISVTFTDKNGNMVSRSDALSICNAPYKITLTSTNGTLTTQYGVPRSSTFGGDTVDYYINPYEYADICSVRPNLLEGKGNYVGLANIWNPDKGFLVQSTNPSSYDLNFPTTGSDGLYFDLVDIVGVDASQLRWSVVTSGDIRATVSWTRPRSDKNAWGYKHDNWIPDKSKYLTRVTLSGPRASDTQINSSNPSPLTRPSLPQTFELVGRDSSGYEVRYGFVLKQWFINRGDKYASAPDQNIWCNSLGYRMPRVKDLTNAKCGVDNWFPCVNGIDGAMPSSGMWQYNRHIGAGFFTEWGDVPRYAANYDSIYWTSDTGEGSNQLTVDSSHGYVYSYNSSYRDHAICTVP